MTRQILIGYMTDSVSNGINKYILNIISALKNEDIQIDVLTSEYSDSFNERMKSLGVNLINISRLSHPAKRYNEIKNIITSKRYDIAYFNVSEAFNCICNIAVKKNSNTVVISHSHSSGNNSENKFKRFFLLNLHKIFKTVITRNSDYYYACSKLAGEWLYSKKVISGSKVRIIRNTVESVKFKYNSDYRRDIRSKIGVPECTKVLGFTGNLVYAKNPFFVIDVFNEITKLDYDVRLLMIGDDGTLKNDLVTYITGLGVLDKVIFTGRVNNVNEFYSAMDAFILPSRFEGMPISGIEAQINGLDCYFSNSITTEVSISDHAHFLDINIDASIWAWQIYQSMAGARKEIHFDNVIYDSNEQKEEFKNIFVKEIF